MKIGLYKSRIHFPHIGMRKVKSIVSLFFAFLLWQVIRLVVPELEQHPVFMYVYSVIEIRETSEKTRRLGKERIKATFTAFGVGFPFLLLMDFLKSYVDTEWASIFIGIILILIGVFLTLLLAEKVGCKTFCGLAAAIFIILLVSHSDDGRYIYAVLRAFQTIFGVFSAWIVNVVLWPYSGKAESSEASEIRQ